MTKKDNKRQEIKKASTQDFSSEEIKKISSFFISVLGYDPVKRPKILHLIDLIKKL